jgi:hypothetical protein
VYTKSTYVERTQRSLRHAYGGVGNRQPVPSSSRGLPYLGKSTSQGEGVVSYDTFFNLDIIGLAPYRFFS